jgi:hypothetical protein
MLMQRQKQYQALLAAIFWAFGVWLTTVDATGADPSRGRQILLSRGLQVQELVFNDYGPINLDTWGSSNFTTVNVWDEATMPVLGEMPAGTPWGRMSQDNDYQIPSDPTSVDSLVSLQYWDEQPVTAAWINQAASKFASWRTLYPNTLGYTNQTPIDSATLANFMQGAQPDMISFVNYPGYSFSGSARNTWYSDMQMFRTAGLAGNDGTGRQPIPYAQFLDLYRNSYSDAIPSESFVRLQQFAGWAFGYTFVSAFVYNNPDSSGVYPAMFSTNDDSSPTSAFGYVAEANRESRNLGPVLVRLLSTGIFMIPGTGQSVSGTGLWQWSAHAGTTTGYTDYLTRITPYTNSTANGGRAAHSYNDILVGYFKPLSTDSGGATFVDGLDFMIVNGASQGTAAASAQWYHLTFDFTGSNFNELVRLDRNTGLVEAVPLTQISGSQYYLDLDLPGGTGDLFTFWNANSPLPAVPEPGALVLAVIGLLGLSAYGLMKEKVSAK